MEKLIQKCTLYEQENLESMAKIYIVIATFFHCVSQAVFKHSHIPIFQALYSRSFLTIQLLHQFYPNDEYYPQNKIKDLIISQVLMVVGTGFQYQSLNYIPMAETAVIFQTNTIWNQVISHILNNEVLTKSRLINTIACFMGILIIVNPTFENSDSFQHTLGCLFALTTSIFQVLSYLYVKRVGSTVRPTVFTFYFHFCMVILCSIGQFYEQSFVFKLSTILTICVMVCLSLVGHLLQYRSVSLVGYSKLAIFTYSSMLFTLILDYFVFGKTTQFMGLFGGTIILIFLLKQLKEDRMDQSLRQKSQLITKQ